MNPSMNESASETDTKYRPYLVRWRSWTPLREYHYEGPIWCETPIDVGRNPGVYAAAVVAGSIDHAKDVILTSLENLSVDEQNASAIFLEVAEQPPGYHPHDANCMARLYNVENTKWPHPYDLPGWEETRRRNPGVTSPKAKVGLPTAEVLAQHLQVGVPARFDAQALIIVAQHMCTLIQRAHYEGDREAATRIKAKSDRLAVLARALRNAEHDMEHDGYTPIRVMEKVAAALGEALGAVLPVEAIEVVVKLAPSANEKKPWDVHLQFTCDGFFEKFFRQGDE